MIRMIRLIFAFSLFILVGAEIVTADPSSRATGSDDPFSVDEHVLVNKLSQKLGDLRPDQIFKQDRFSIWWEEINGQKYVFKKRQDGLSEHQKQGFVFGDSQNLQRYDEAERVRNYIASESIEHIKVPKIRKVRFKEDGLPESDFNTAIVEQYVPYPDLVEDGTRSHVVANSIPDQIYRNVGRIAAFGVTDLHGGNLKYDQQNQDIWLTDLENTALYHRDLLNNNIFLRPLSPYLNWQMDQAQKSGALSGFAVASSEYSGKEEIIAEAYRSARWIGIKTEAVKIIVAIGIYQLAKYLYANTDRQTAKFVLMTNLVDANLSQCSNCDVDEITVNTVRMMDPAESRAEVFALFKQYQKVSVELAAYVAEQESISVVDSKIATLEKELLSIEQKVKALWAPTLTQKFFNFAR